MVLILTYSMGVNISYIVVNICVGYKIYDTVHKQQNSLLEYLGNCNNVTLTKPNKIYILSKVLHGL